MRFLAGKGLVSGAKALAGLFGVLLAGAVVWDLATQPPMEPASATIQLVDAAGVCNGQSPCFTTIQSAITAASAGDVILVFPGVYVENVNVNKALTLASIEGAEDTTIQAATSANNANAVNIVTNNVRFGVPELGFTVIGGQFGIGTNTGTLGVFIASNEVHGYLTIGIAFGSSQGAIEDNEIVGPNQAVTSGIYLSIGASHVVIRDNEIANNRNGIIAVEGNNAGILITDNEIVNTRRAIRIQPGLNTAGNFFRNSEISENKIEAGDGPGIVIQETGGGVVDHLVISDNEVKSRSAADTSFGAATGDGIYVEGDHNVVNDNEVSLNAGDGIQVVGNHNSVLNNEDEDNGGCGIKASGTGNFFAGNEAEGNADDAIPC